MPWEKCMQTCALQRSSNSENFWETIFLHPTNGSRRNNKMSFWVTKMDGLVSGAGGFDTPGPWSTFLTVGEFAAWACSIFCNHAPCYNQYAWIDTNKQADGWHVVYAHTSFPNIVAQSKKFIVHAVMPDHDDMFFIYRCH